MKKLIGLALLLASTTHAQLPNISEQDMASMMGMVNGLATCMAQLDEQRLEALGKRAEKSGQEIESLCTAGKRNEAQAKALRHVEEFLADPEYKKFMQCGEAAQGMLPNLATLHDLAPEDESQHVCDAL
jgi:hypothetical protein